MFKYTAQVIRIIDGDTFEVLLDLGFGVFRKEKLRLARIDTPETYGVKKESAEYKAGKEATEFVKEWCKITNNKIVVHTIRDKKGSFGRYLAEVYAFEGDDKDKNLNDILLFEGLAVLYKK